MFLDEELKVEKPVIVQLIQQGFRCVLGTARTYTGQTFYANYCSLIAAKGRQYHA